MTTNAKTFNPPGSIYHNEAERIETWALEHITKAAGTVIEYETDWNIDVERDYDPEDGDKERTGDGEKGRGTPMDGDDAGSITSAQTPGSAHPGKRKAGEKGKKPPGALSESLEADGGLPGTKDGLGAFPPGSDWAELMLALKLKGALLMRCASMFTHRYQESGIVRRRNDYGWNEAVRRTDQMAVWTMQNSRSPSPSSSSLSLILHRVPCLHRCILLRPPQNNQHNHRPRPCIHPSRHPSSYPPH